MSTAEIILYICCATLLGVGVFSELYVESGSTAVLTCPYQATTDAIIWRGPQQLSIYAINNKVNNDVPHSSRIQIGGNFTAGEYVLKLVNFTKADEGMYQCDTIDNDKAVKFKIVALIAASVVRIVNRDIHCNMWSTVNLTCQTTLDIASTFENIWVQTYNEVLIDKRAGHIKGNFSVLSIPFCVYQDAGSYTCKWFNKTMEYTDSTELYVRSRPVCTEKKIKHHGDKILLEVNFYSQPEPNLVFWYHNDDIITSVDKYERHVKTSSVQLSIKTKNITTNGFVATLIITNVTKSDIAVYTCAVQNSLGVIDVHFNKKIIIEAMVSKNGTFIRKTTELHVIMWTVVYAAISSAVVLIAAITVMILWRRQKEQMYQTSIVTDIRIQTANENIILEQRRISQGSISSNREYEDINSVISNTEYQQSIQIDPSYMNEIINNDATEYDNEASNTYVDLYTDRELHTYWKYDGEYQYL